MNISDKQGNNSELGDKITSPQAIIDRLKNALNAKSDGQLASSLGISRQNIGAARKRNDVPTGWIYKVAEMTGCSMDWLSFGQGPRKRTARYDEPQAGERSELASPQAAYRRLAAPPKPGPGEKQEQGVSFGAAVEMLAKIYNSGDAAIINAVSANIRAFCEVLER